MRRPPTFCLLKAKKQLSFWTSSVFWSPESKKPITDKLLKNLPVDLKKKLEKSKRISQTEYYYLREKYEYKQNKLFFVYLKPSVIPKECGLDYKYISEKKFNDWVVLTKCGVENPWKTMTFYELSEIQQKIESNNAPLSENAILYNGYKNFIKYKFGKGVVDITNYKKNESNYGKYDFFRLIYNKLLELEITGKLESNSSHNNEPLIEYYKEFRTPKEVKDFLKGGDDEFLIKGVQLQGCTLKFNIHAKDYDNVIPEKRKQYNDWCYKKLEGLSKELIEKRLVNKLRKNPSRTKTGCSLSQIEKLDENMSVDEHVTKLKTIINIFLKNN